MHKPLVISSACVSMKMPLAIPEEDGEQFRPYI